MKYKALIIDFDGTTIKNGQYERPTPTVIEAIEKAKGKLLVCDATGRPLSTAQWIFQDLHLTSPSIISAGTKIVDPVSAKTLWKIALPKEKVEEILSITNSYTFKTITESQLATFPSQEERIPQEEGVIYVVEIPMDKSAQLLRKLNNISDISIHTVKGYEQDTIDIHITHKKGTKEHALTELKKMLGINTQEIIGVGDSFNDIPLFKAVGLKVAMGNGAEELKAIADYIAPSVEEDGVADVIEKFVLHSK